MEKKVAALLCTFCLLLFSCKQGMKEVVEETYPDGKPRVVKFYQKHNGKEELQKEVCYYPNGQKMSEGEYVENQMNGLWTYWYESGKVWTTGNYRKGVDHGLKTVYHPNGAKYYEGMFENGERVGLWKFWDENGAKINEIDYNQKKSK